jgi:hypothetical protein
MARSNHRLYKKIESYFSDIRFNSKRHITARFMQKSTRGFSWERLFRMFACEMAQKGETQTHGNSDAKPSLNVFKRIVP